MTDNLLIAKWYSYDKLETQEAVVHDAEGTPIPEDGLVRTIQNWTWGKKGELLRVTGVRAGDHNMSLYVATTRGSTTGIDVTKVAVVTDPALERVYEIACRENRLARVKTAIAELQAERRILVAEIHALETHDEVTID